MLSAARRGLLSSSLLAAMESREERKQEKQDPRLQASNEPLEIPSSPFSDVTCPARVAHPGVV